VAAFVPIKASDRQSSVLFSVPPARLEETDRFWGDNRPPMLISCAWTSRNIALVRWMTSVETIAWLANLRQRPIWLRAKEDFAKLNWAETPITASQRFRPWATRCTVTLSASHRRRAFHFFAFTAARSRDFRVGTLFPPHAPSLGGTGAPSRWRLPTRFAASNNSPVLRRKRESL